MLLRMLLPIELYSAFAIAAVISMAEVRLPTKL